MSWRDAQVTHIFVPADQTHDNWVEQVLGTVIKPLVERYDDQIHWIWITRYTLSYNDLPTQIKTYFRVKPISVSYLVPEYEQYRFVTFRLSVEESAREQFQQTADSLIQSSGFYTVSWEAHDIVDKLGINRYIHPDAEAGKRVHRTRLVVNFMDATVRLMLHSLIEEGGQWKREPNEDKQQNPTGTFFQSVHHLFCNATDVPTQILIGKDQPSGQSTDNLKVTTYFMGGNGFYLPIQLKDLSEEQWLPVDVLF